jgi:ABC-type glycerol-3-phosphate transport system substrate-binding protein
VQLLEIPFGRFRAPGGGRPLYACAIAIIIALSACGPLGASNGSHSLSIWYSTDDPVEKVWSRQLGQMFEQSHPGTHVVVTPYDFEDENPKLQLALKAGDPPDLAYTTPRTCGIPVYVQHHYLLNLTSQARRYGWGPKLRTGLLQDYNSPFALYATQKPGTAGGRVPVYAVPYAMAAVGVMYNKAILHKLHINVPTTFAAFESDLARAKAAGYTPAALGNADGWLGDDWYQTIVNRLYPYKDLERELRLVPSFSFQRPGFEPAAAMMQGWAAKGYFTPHFADLEAQDGVDYFFRGNTLFDLISSSEDSQILSDQRATHVPVGVFPFPTNDGSAVVPQSGYEGWIIPKQAKHIQLAVKFINWLLSKHVTAFLLRNGMLPAEPVAASSASAGWERSFLKAVDSARPGVYLDAAPIPNLNATMEANVQLLMNGPGVEEPTFLPKAMQQVYATHGRRHGQVIAIDCEF